MRYLLDTDCIIDYLSGVASTVAFLRALAAQGHHFCTCAVVVCEVYTGVLPHHQQAADQLFGALEYLPTSAQAATQAGRWRQRHRAQGQQLAATDCLIAAVAQDHTTQLVTANLRDFPMPELTLAPLPRARE